MLECGMNKVEKYFSSELKPLEGNTVQIIFIKA